ncbi:LPS export ABC transporter permease LptF [Marinospirillum insulare]|uniref:Lipopolysaccharide export system permease protein LptF n=1 Tax=Marinospirillum insulare TaxID=217169 RepID=A0ABQ5ZV42_9GAMM|nr:LPS export ABC transporter permease LptF [Marinospirillum insulare]GLR63874.1 LPS export ABC transporter permease LptF [Marinospirillum insulare]
MILYRYIAREIIISTLAVGSILLLVIVGSRFARFLNRVASGRISLDILGQLTLFYTPYALQLIIPLSFVLALMLTFGRLYMESEMSVIQSSGVSQRQLMQLVLVLALGVASLTAFSSLYLTPKAQFASELMMQEQQEKTGFESVATGQFTHLNKQTIFVNQQNEDNTLLEGVFIAEVAEGKATLALADRAYQQISDETLSRFLVLEDGWRYELPSIDLTSSSLEFDRYALRVGVYSPPSVQEQVAMLSLNKLLADKSLAAKVELQWRLSLPVLVLVMVFIALPLTKVNPRQGRFIAILPVLLLELIYLGGLMSLQGAINKEQWPVWPGMWLVHFGFFSMGLALCWRRGVFKS